MIHTDRMIATIDWVNSHLKDCEPIPSNVGPKKGEQKFSGLLVHKEWSAAHTTYLRSEGRPHQCNTIYVDDEDYPSIMVFQNRFNEWCAVSIERIRTFSFEKTRFRGVILPIDDRAWFDYGRSVEGALEGLVMTLRGLVQETQAELTEQMRALAQSERFAERILHLRAKQRIEVDEMAKKAVEWVKE